MGVSSLVWIFGLFSTLFLKLLVLNMISTTVLSPEGSLFFFSGALVQLQPGIIRSILRVSSPVDSSQNL